MVPALAVLFLTATPASVALAGYRLAYSADGNAGDWDDIGSSGMALAIMAKFLGSEKWRLVHFEYNNNIVTGNLDGTPGPPRNNPTMNSHHATTVTQGISQFGFDPANFYDAYANTTDAANHLAAAINAAWTAGDAMYIIGAGPMETIYRGVSAANPSARANVTIISHSTWNDTYGGPYNFPGYPLTRTKDDIVPLGVTWLSIATQLGLQSDMNCEGTGAYPCSIPQNHAVWNPFRFLSTSSNPALNWLWGRMNLEGRPDTSDAGMVYYLFSGFQYVVPEVSSTWPSGWNPVGYDPSQTLHQLLDPPQVGTPTISSSASTAKNSSASCSRG
jgi:hypothetical protein